MKLAVSLELFDDKLVLFLILFILLLIFFSLNLLDHAIGAVSDIVDQPLRRIEDVPQFLVGD